MYLEELIFNSPNSAYQKFIVKFEMRVPLKILGV